MPVAPEAERNLLTSLIQDPLALDSLPGLSALDFYIPNHRFLCMAILELRHKQIDIDRVTLNEQIDKTCTVLGSNRPSDLSQLWINGVCDDQVPIGIQKNYYRLLVEKATLRKVITFATEQAVKAYEFGIGDDLDTFLDKMEESVMKFRNMRNEDDSMKDGRAVLEIVAEEFRKEAENPEPAEIKKGINTGITEIDNHTAGLQSEEMIVIAARPSHGKTALMMHLILAAAVKTEVPSAVFSLEMGADQLMERAASMLTGIDTMSVKRYQVDRREREVWLRAYEKVQAGAITIDDDPDLTIDEIRARARRMKREKGIRFIAIDYLQLIKSHSKDKFKGRTEVVGEISAGCKAMAKELKVPVVILAQLNRELEKREDKKPRLSDLRESGSIEQDADQVWAIYREHGIESDGFDILSLKGRSTGLFQKVELLFDGETQRLSSIHDSQMSLL